MHPLQEGEVCISGPNVMQGYHKNPGATAEVIFEYEGRRYFRYACTLVSLWCLVYGTHRS